MKNFRLLDRDLNVASVLEEIDSVEFAWFAQTGRQNRCAAQVETNAIPLRGIKKSKILGRRRRDVHETRTTSIGREFPETLSLLEQLARQLDGKLGRAKLARLPAGASVYPHVDRGEYYLRRDRYHLVIDSPGDSTLIAGSERGRLKTGELWWFDNQTLHSAINDTEFDRIHLVFDLEPKSNLEPRYSRSTDAAEVFAELRSRPKCSGVRSVTSGVKLYDAIRANPESWRPILVSSGNLERANNNPLTVMAELLWPNLNDSRRKRRVIAMGWALANIDIGRFKINRVRRELIKSGGIREICRRWRSSKEELIYGSEEMSPQSGKVDQ